MKLNSNKIKASVAAYFRYVRQCYVVAFEADSADTMPQRRRNAATDAGQHTQKHPGHRQGGRGHRVHGDVRARDAEQPYQAPRSAGIRGRRRQRSIENRPRYEQRDRCQAIRRHHRRDVGSAGV